MPKGAGRPPRANAKRKTITMTMRYVHPAAEQKRLAAAKLETFRVNGLMVAASEEPAETGKGKMQ
jgi:hypothetical protein